MEARRAVFQAYHPLVKQQLKPMIEFCTGLSPQAYAVLPWNLPRRSTTSLVPCLINTLAV